MTETRRTLTFAGIALLLAVIAFATAPRRATPEALLDLGEPFFPEFTNPEQAASLEVVAFDEETAEAQAFKVTNRGGLWTIPSHHDYPADGADRLARTAAGVIGIVKEDFRTDNVADHETCGVIDPLDETAPLHGRGRRVTMRGPNDQILADFIIGREIEDRDASRFVRIPDQKRVYVAKMDLDISTRFEDWIEQDLLKVDQWAIEEVILRDYSIDERTFMVDERDTIRLKKSDGTWSADGMKADQQVDGTKMTDLLNALDNLKITGVRPKPQGLSAGLKRIEEDGGLRISQADLLSLQDKGFYFARDGSLLSNDGELQARTQDGILYTLRFGEIVYGRGETITAGTEADEERQGPGENRYLFITAEFESDRYPEPPKPSDLTFQDKPEVEWTDADRRNKGLHEKHEAWASKYGAAREKAQQLNARFADWYYVIPSSGFDKIHLTRRDLVVKKSA